MRYRFIFLTIAMLALCFINAMGAKAATLNVPVDHPTITAALLAASAGDTIMISNSATYTETLVIDKPTTIVASLGQTPTIKSPAGTFEYVILIQAAGSGSQIGKVGMGRINIDGTNASARILIAIEGAPNLDRLQNLRLFGATSYGVLTYNTAGIVKRELTEVEIDGAGMDSYAVRPHARELAGSQISLIRCQFINNPYQGIYFNQGQGTWIIRQCKFIGSREGIYFDQVNGALDVEVDECIFMPSAGYWAFRSQDIPDNSINFSATNSVFYGAWDSLYWSGNQGNCLYTFTNCDISTSDEAHNTVIVEGDAYGAYSIELKDCIIIGGSPASATRYAIHNKVPELTEQIVANNCNIFTSITPKTLDVTLINDIDPGLDPSYVNYAVLNWTYLNAFLKSASSTGGVVGSNRDFSGIVPVPGPGAPSRVGTWTYY